MTTKFELEDNYLENDFFASTKSVSNSLKQGVLEPRTAERSTKNKHRSDTNVSSSRNHRRIDSARSKLSLLSRKYVLTKRCVDDLEDSLAEIGNSINSLQKLDRMLSGEGKRKGTVGSNSSSPGEDHLSVLEKLMAESTESVNRLQKEIKMYQTKTVQNDEEEHLAEVGSESCRSSSRFSFNDEIQRSNFEPVVTKGDISSYSSLDEQLDVYRKQNKEIFLDEWESRKQYLDKITELENLKTKVQESKGHVNSDEVFSKVFKEWLEVRCSETYLKTQKFLFGQALQQLQHNHAVNSLDVQKCELASKELEELEVKVLSNQKLLQELFHDVSMQSKSIENARKSAHNSVNQRLMPALDISETIKQLPLTGCRILESSQKCNFTSTDRDLLFPDTSLREKKFQNISFFRNSLKQLLHVPSGSLDIEIVHEVLKRRKRKALLQNQLQKISSGSDSAVCTTDEIEKRLSEIKEDLRQLEVLQSEQSFSEKIRTNSKETEKVLSNIGHSLLELEEGAQYSVPWISIDGVNYRQYVQLMRHAYSSNTLKSFASN